MEAWKALLDTPVEKLATPTPEGLAIEPLYVEGPVPAQRPGTGHWQVCMRADRAYLDDDIAGGADALWVDAHDDNALEAAVAANLPVICEVGDANPATALAWFAPLEGPRGMLAIDPISSLMRGAPAGTLAPRLDALAAVSRTTTLRIARVSTLPFHDAGADAADELALSLATGTAYLRILDGTQLSLQVAVGRDTFGELCKLRALRLCWSKLLAAVSCKGVPPIHAVCSSRTQTLHDPWVNMLRVTTQVFAAALGGADLVTPLPFDASPHARRVARNAALVLRDESHLGRVIDPGGGSYYLESRTDALAREAWRRFQQIEAEGGIAAMLVDGRLAKRLEASWAVRAAALGKRKEPVLGVSEFANVGEELPAPPTPGPGHRDSEAFEALRDRAPQGEVALVVLGPASEHRARAGFATGLFAVAGLRTHEHVPGEALEIACICGSDERYATEAVAVAAQLRAAGARHVVLAGRPGALEGDLRKAGADAFIYLGCDVLATLTELIK